MLEKKVQLLENKLKNLESQLNISPTPNVANPYQSSMHMMW